MYRYTNLRGTKSHNKNGIFLKILVALIGCFLLVSTTSAQKKGKVSRYETFVYASDSMDVLIQHEYKKQWEEKKREKEVDKAGYLSLLGVAALNAGKGIAGGYVTSVIDIGVNAIAGLITQNANNKIKWETVVKAENSYQEMLTTVEPINNFYTYPSYDGPMDPDGMNFAGIGCLCTIEGDTTFFVSCRIDPEKIHRIVNHSKFELSLDTLIIDPYKSDLPNSNFDTVFTFERRNNFQVIIEMRLISSWINEMTQLQKNQELGSFVITVPVSKADLVNGKLRYVRSADTPAKYKIAGESFIIPRSFMGSRDENNNYRKSWGTGDYKIEISLKQTCGITDEYRKIWKNDWNRRQQFENDENFIQRSWTTVTSQRWDEITKRWVITTLKAPADIITKDLLKELDIVKK